MAAFLYHPNKRNSMNATFKQLNWINLPANVKLVNLGLHDATLCSVTSDLLGRTLTLVFDAQYLLDDSIDDADCPKFLFQLHGVQLALVLATASFNGDIPIPDTDGEPPRVIDRRIHIRPGSRTPSDSSACCSEIIGSIAEREGTDSNSRPSPGIITGHSGSRAIKRCFPLWPS